MNKNPTVVIVCGYPGAGKSFFAKRISRLLGTRIINKDETMEATVARMNLELGNPVEDRHSEDYIKFVRPFEYEVLLRTVTQALERGHNLILDAPLVVEVSTDGWMEKVRAGLLERGYDALFVWMESSLEDNKARLTERNSSEDNWKVNNWDEYIDIMKSFPIPREKFDFIVNATGQRKEISEIIKKIE